MPILGVIASSKLTAPAGSFESIATYTVTSDQATITLSSIPATYKSLRIICTLRVNGPSGSAMYGGWTTLNGSSTGYHIIGFENYGNVNYYTDQTDTRFYHLYSTSDNTNGLAVTVYDIVDYANTNKPKLILHKQGGGWNVTSGGDAAANSVVWNNTSAINSISFSPNTGFGAFNYTAGSQIEIYGLVG